VKATTAPPEYELVARALRDAPRVLVTTHENPDGDALGSTLAAWLGLTRLGKDVVMYLAGTIGLPREYDFMDFSALTRTPPADVADRLVLALDCANARRVGPDHAIFDEAATVVNVDHHHDNTRFGDVNLVVPEASSTGEILRDVLGLLGVELDPPLAQALYIALVTDTGRFQYSNTTPKALRLAAELVEAGADAYRVYQDVYENVAFEKLKLLARALERARVYEGGRVIVSVLTRDDFDAAGADEPFAEGIIDYLRAVEGAELVALIREPPRGNGGPPRKVSLRTTHDELDVSAIARSFGGGGHRQAAGFHTDLEVEELVEGIRRAFRVIAAPGAA
jgi:phosphoesterase RecJ-like protein